MSRTLADSREWMTSGTVLMTNAVSALDDESFSAATALPGWTRRHVVAHVAANAEAIGNLVRWAATGVETPMYISAQARAAGIERGVGLAAAELKLWLAVSAEQLAVAMDRLTEDQWQQLVRTAQGRTVPATETPWMRAREVCVHAVDLGAGIEFEDLPREFNRALCLDIQAKRGLATLPPEAAAASLPDVSAWLAGRPHSIANAPELGPWL